MIFKKVLAAPLALDSDAQASGDNDVQLQVIDYTTKICTAISCLLVVLQIAASIAFYVRSRHMKEENWLPKLLMALTNLNGFVYLVFYVIGNFLDYQFSDVFLIVIESIYTITYPIIFGLLIRFQRVQVQLKTQEENTVKIFKTIKKASVLEKVFIVALFISNTCYIISDYGDQIFGVFQYKQTVLQVINTFGNFTEIVLFCIFCSTMWLMNKQLDLFFKMVGIRSYPKKTIILIIVLLFLIVTSFDSLEILQYYVFISEVQWTIQGWLYDIIERIVFLIVTVSFYYFADFDFEKRSRKKMSEEK